MTDIDILKKAGEIKMALAKGPTCLGDCDKCKVLDNTERKCGELLASDSLSLIIALQTKVENLTKAQAEAEKNEPLTQEQISGMHFDKIWLDYGEDNGGEWAVVLFGKIYSIDTLEGAGFEELLLDLVDGETLDHPSGQYTVRRHKPKELEGGADK